MVQTQKVIQQASLLLGVLLVKTFLKPPTFKVKGHRTPPCLNERNAKELGREAHFLKTF